MDIRLNENLLSKQTDINEFNITDNIIPKFIKSFDFDSLNYLQCKTGSGGLSCETLFLGGNIEFLSINKDINTPYYNLLSEKEFLKIAGYNKGRPLVRTGNYQKSLYGHYLKAKTEKDSGYLSDVLKKAVVLRNNINHVKKLMHDEYFMTKWRKNYGQKSPLSVLKNSGSMTLINIINAL